MKENHVKLCKDYMVLFLVGRKCSMALINCPRCGRQISDRARKCPGCDWVPGSQPEEENVSKQESRGVYEVDTNNIEIKKLRNEKIELRKKVQELQSHNAQLSMVVKNGDIKMQEVIGRLQDEKKQIVAEKELIAQKLHEIENQAPQIVDNTDYETIRKQQRELEILQEKNIQLNMKLKEEQKKPEVIDNTDYVTLKKQADIIETLQREKNELKNTLEEVEHRQAGSAEKIRADTINELKKN